MTRRDFKVPARISPTTAALRRTSLRTRQLYRICRSGHLWYRVVGAAQIQDEERTTTGEQDSHRIPAAGYTRTRLPATPYSPQPCYYSRLSRRTNAPRKLHALLLQNQRLPMQVSRWEAARALGHSQMFERLSQTIATREAASHGASVAVRFRTPLTETRSNAIPYMIRDGDFDEGAQNVGPRSSFPIRLHRIRCSKWRTAWQFCEVRHVAKHSLGICSRSPQPSDSPVAEPMTTSFI